MRVILGRAIPRRTDRVITDVEALPIYLTILTTSYNRAHLLPRLRDSIAANLPDGVGIEWLIVDDGSTDDTAFRVENFKREAPFPLRYLAVEHGGKHRALNAGFGVAGGRWVMVVDSDDRLVDGGIETALAEIGKAGGTGAGVLFLCVTVENKDRQYTFEQPGRSLPYLDRFNMEPLFDGTLILHRDVYQLRFPEIPGETFLSEGAFFLRLNDDHKVYLSNAVAVAVEYQPDGLSANSLALRARNPIGAAWLYREMLDYDLRWGLRSRTLVNFGRFWWHCVFKGVRPVRPRGILQVASIVSGLVLAMADNAKMRIDDLSRRA